LFRRFTFATLKRNPAAGSFYKGTQSATVI